MDRCDNCNAQAFVKVVDAAGQDLLFCGHHYSKHEVQLIIQGFTVSEDERSFINLAASASSGTAADDVPDKPSGKGSTSR